MTRTTAKKPANADPAPVPEGRTRKASRAGSGKASPAATRAELARELGREIEALRASCKGMLQAYELRVGAQLLAAAEALAPAAKGGEARLPRAAALRAALAAIRAVTLKPAKGRPKDFARLARLADTIAELLAEERAAGAAD